MTFGKLARTVVVACSLGSSVSLAADPPGDWTKLFADEAWYRDEAGEERTFRGKLEAVKPPQASTLMRNSLYQLGEWRIYTGARKIPSLDGLVGKQVEILGKAVEMNLEGEQLKEIWPASIRVAETTVAAAPDGTSAVALAREYLTRNGVKAERHQAFPIPGPANEWWMVEYAVPGEPQLGAGPVVYVNRRTGEVTRQAPKGMPPRM
jgi:hypothetical protein